MSDIKTEKRDNEFSRCLNKKDFRRTYEEALAVAKSEGFENVTEMILVMTKKFSVRALERRWGFTPDWIKNKMKILEIPVRPRGGPNNKWGRWGNPDTYIERYQTTPYHKEKGRCLKEKLIEIKKK